jgi:hypothetical protein
MVCDSPNRDEIDRELVARVHLRKLSARYGMSPASLSRHRSFHILPGTLVVLRPPLPPDAGFIERLEAQAQRLEAFIDQAEAGKHAEQVIVGIRELRATLESIARAKGEIDRPPVVINLQQSEEWVETRIALMQALKPHRAARDAVVEALLRLDKAET